jgi:hypothetical protein
VCVQRAFGFRFEALGWAEEPTQEASHIDIEERLGSSIDDGQHCARRVEADTRQALQVLARFGNAAIRLNGLSQMLESLCLSPPEPA